jgi:hypothetical protein
MQPLVEAEERDDSLVLGEVAPDQTIAVTPWVCAPCLGG